MRTMMFAKIKTAAAVLCAATVLSVGGGIVARHLTAAEPIELPAGKWVELNDDTLGYVNHIGEGRYSYRGPALLYVPQLKRFLVAMGIQCRPGSKEIPCYSESTLSTKTGVWENWYPKGKDWGPETGPALWYTLPR